MPRRYSVESIFSVGGISELLGDVPVPRRYSVESIFSVGGISESRRFSTAFDVHNTVGEVPVPRLFHAHWCRFQPHHSPLTANHQPPTADHPYIVGAVSNRAELH